MKSARLLTMYVGSGLLLGSALFWVLVQFVPHAWVTLRDVTHGIAYACTSAWATITQQQLTLTIVGLSLVALVGMRVAILVWKASRQRGAVLPAEVFPSVDVLSVAADAGLDASRLGVVNDTQAYAYTRGIRHPEVIVSRGALRRLTRAELRAVLEHEAHHLRTREPLRRMFLHLATRWLPVRPLRRQLLTSYIIASEVEADLQVRNQHALGEAILRLGHVPSAVATTAAGFSPLDARIERLLDRTYRPSSALSIRYVLGLLGIAAALVIATPSALAVWFGGEHMQQTVDHLAVCKQEHERQLQTADPLRTCDGQSATKTCAP